MSGTSASISRPDPRPGGGNEHLIGSRHATHHHFVGPSHNRERCRSRFDGPLSGEWKSNGSGGNGSFRLSLEPARTVSGNVKSLLHSPVKMSRPSCAKSKWSSPSWKLPT